MVNRVLQSTESSNLQRWTFEEYSHPAKVVARRLLGQRLVRVVNGRRLSGVIVETEAYCDSDKPDLACHGDRANSGRPTDRTRVMFGPAGIVYVYFTYGMHWMLNIVTGTIGKANAVLIRSLEPYEGVAIMEMNRRGRTKSELTNGPGKLAQALMVDKALNGANLCVADSVIWVEKTETADQQSVCTGPRVGLGKTPEPWLSVPWRFWLEDNIYVSQPR